MIPLCDIFQDRNQRNTAGVRKEEEALGVARSSLQADFRYRRPEDICMGCEETGSHSEEVVNVLPQFARRLRNNIESDVRMSGDDLADGNQWRICLYRDGSLPYS